MAITDIEDEIFQREAKPIFDALVPLVGRGFTNETYGIMLGVIDYYTPIIRRTCPRFPKLVPVILPRQGHVEVARADMEHAGIQQLMRNFIIRFPGIKPNEIVEGIKRAFPDYRPQI